MIFITFKILFTKEFPSLEMCLFLFQFWKKYPLSEEFQSENPKSKPVLTSTKSTLTCPILKPLLLRVTMTRESVLILLKKKDKTTKERDMEEIKDKGMDRVDPVKMEEFTELTDTAIS